MGALIFLITLGIAFLIANFLDKKRQIGFGWSFFFCIFLSPIGGFITTMLSRKHYDPNPEPSSTKRVIGWILIVLFTLTLLTGLISLNKVTTEMLPNIVNALGFYVGFIGLGIYLWGLSNGKNYNIDALTKVDD